MNITNAIADRLKIPREKVSRTVDLLLDDNTIPFIARYRKEMTGNLNEIQIRDIQETFQQVRKLADRRETILETIESQGKLIPELEQQIQEADNLTRLEDLYRPFRPKRKTRATRAREKGLAPLAEMIIAQPIHQGTIKDHLLPFLNENVPDMEAALEGAKDIVAEVISENPDVREVAREKALKFGKISCQKLHDAEDPRRVYKDYYDLDLPIRYIKPHQVLAINRGEGENVLKVQTHFKEGDWRLAVRSEFPPDRRSVFFNALNEAAEDAAQRLLLPAIERDVRRQLTEEAEVHAIQVFATNLEALLTQPPLAGQTILAVDPAYRTGCKLAVIDPTGKCLVTGTIYPHPPQNQKQAAQAQLRDWIDQYQVSLIVIGNGTASRETEQMTAEITRDRDGLSYLITSEAGASVYSASELARREFPDLDVSIRGAISIGRRVQDPLAELVKIDPQSIGVGLYQHDINQNDLRNALEQVVERVVNTVGVDLNTASPALLAHVAGIGPSLAEKIIQHRDAYGPFSNRKELLNISGLGPKTFEQAAGFLRIRNGENPLDATAIHPESYPIAARILQKLDLPMNASSDQRIHCVAHFIETSDLHALARDLGTGIHTLEDILEEIARPGRDPREDLPKPILRQDVITMEDLSPGMQLKGTIRNVVDFGAFVDIGVKTDGLLHRSRIPESCQLKVGDIIIVSILSIDSHRNRIALDLEGRKGT